MKLEIKVTYRKETESEKPQMKIGFESGISGLFNMDHIIAKKAAVGMVVVCDATIKARVDKTDKEKCYLNITVHTVHDIKRSEDDARFSDLPDLVESTSTTNNSNNSHLKLVGNCGRM